MTGADARIILRGLLPDGFDPHDLSRSGRQEVRDAIDKVLDLVYDPTFDAGASLEIRLRELCADPGPISAVTRAYSSPYDAAKSTSIITQ
jgi:hypothetical protein